MKRSTLIIVTVLLISCTAIVFGNQFKHNVPVDTYKRMGEELKNSIHTLDEQKKMIDSNEIMKSEIAGEIMGRKVSVAEVEVKAIMYKYAGSENPVQDAWTALEIEALEYEFAKEHGLLPKEKEIVEFTNSMREIVEADKEGLLFEKTILDAVGMTADYYWEVYKPSVESPVHLTKINIAKYCEEYDIDWNSILIDKEIQSELTNTELLAKYEN